jgi:choline kinase
VVDVDWRSYYVNRDDHPVDEAETVVLDTRNDVFRIGKNLTENYDVHGEFIGMMKFTPQGAKLFKSHFHLAKATYWDGPFQRAPKFQVAYLTDLIQEMTHLGVPTHCVLIERGWKEIDTDRDYEKALKEFSSPLVPAKQAALLTTNDSTHKMIWMFVQCAIARGK